MSTILPSYMNDVWKCYEQLHREDLVEINPLLVNVSPEYCHISILPFLAWECDVDISNFSEEVARKMIRSAINAMRYSGTVAAVVETIEAISNQARVTEWPEYDGEPYHFKIDIDVTDTGVDEEMILNLEKSVVKQKNVRSILEALKINLTTKAKIKTALLTQVGEIATLYPYQLEEIDFKHIFNKQALMMQSVEILYIYPQGGK